MTLLRYFSLRHWRRHPVRAAMGVATVMLGVALYVAVEVTYASSFAAFEESVDALAGRATIQVSRGRGMGVDHEALRTIESLGYDAAPVFHATTTLSGVEEGPVMVVGVDPLREMKLRDFSVGGRASVDIWTLITDSNAILITRRLAERHGWREGSTFEANTPNGFRTFRVAGLLDEAGPARIFSGNIAVMLMASAQHHFGRRRLYDRIDVAAPADAIAKLRAALPDHEVVPVSRRNSVLDEVLTRVRSLVAIGMIALMVGLFMIYNSMSISVVERAREIGTIRSLGATPRAVMGMFLVEALVVGSLGSAAGVAAGAALAKGLVEFTAQQVNNLMFVVVVERIVLSPATVIVGAAMGVLTSLAATLYPAWQATRISPLEAMRPSRTATRLGVHYRGSFVLGLVLAAASAAIAALPPQGAPMALLVAAPAVSLLAVGLILPQVTLWLGAALRGPLRNLFRLHGALAANSLLQTPQRTALTVVALGGALGMMVATATAVRGFQKSTEDFLDSVLPFDMFVAATDMSMTIYSTATYPREISERILAVEGVEMGYPVRSVMQPYGDVDLLIIAVDVETFGAMHAARGTPEKAFRWPLDDGDVVISENLAVLHGYGVGDAIALTTPDGPREFRIAGTVEDYSWPQGSILMEIEVYRRLWRDESVSYTDIRVAPGYTVEQVKANVAGAVEGQFKVFAYSTADLRALSEDALDQSFRFANILVVIAGVIGFLGIVNTLMISVMRRTREIGLLRAVGMTRGQVAASILLEGVLMAAVGGVLGAAGGVIGAWYPMAALTLKTTGFAMPRVVPWVTLGLAVASAVLVGLAAAAVPARRAAGIRVLDAIAYE